jgi:hypothetical protein
MEGKDMTAATANNVIRVGDRVTPKAPVKPYYSGYAGNPEVTIYPGMVGVVAVTRVPAVMRVGHRTEFNCVDFNLPGVYQGDPLQWGRVQVNAESDRVGWAVFFGSVAVFCEWVARRAGRGL